MRYILRPRPDGRGWDLEGERLGGCAGGHWFADREAAASYAEWHGGTNGGGMLVILDGAGKVVEERELAKRSGCLGPEG